MNTKGEARGEHPLGQPWTRWFPGVLALLLVLPCCSPRPTGFVELQKGRFMLNDEPFFPLVINYLADLQWAGDSCWAASSLNYRAVGRYPSVTSGEARLQVKSDFRSMVKMGFNTVRFGLAPDLIIPEEGGTPLLPSRYGWGTDTLLPFEGPWKNRYLDALEGIVGIAEEEGLKVILLLHMRPYNQQLDDFAIHALDRMKGHTGILAYDLFNEPLYFDHPHHRPKNEVKTIVKKWRRLFRKHAPHQLTTIGLAGVLEAFSWDPALLAVDFISFHPYEYEPHQVLNEIHWYGAQVRKPWIIGETSLPADDDSVSYADQMAFARKTLEQTRACGGIGYSWWQFMDVQWGKFHSDFMGVMERKGSTVTGAGLPAVPGTAKPMAEVFRTFNQAEPPGTCEKPDNYYNFSSLEDARLIGRLVDRDGKPLEDALALAWNEDWTASYYTKTKADGTFELYGDFRFHHWMVSASGYTMERDDCNEEQFIVGADGVPTIDLGTTVLYPVSWQGRFLKHMDRRLRRTNGKCSSSSGITVS